MPTDRKDLATPWRFAKAIDDDYKEAMRELRALFHEAKAEAEKDEPERELKALLADGNEWSRPSPGSTRCGRACSGWHDVRLRERRDSRSVNPRGESWPRHDLASALGCPLHARIRHPRCRCHHGTHGPAALRQSHPDDDRRRRPRPAQALLQVPFHRRHPPDTTLIPISRTVGEDQIVDEMLFCFTHTSEIDWMLPGIAPTGKYVEVPLVAIVVSRATSCARTHLLGSGVGAGADRPARTQGLPVAGVETASKLADKTLPSNRLMSRWANSARKPI